MTETYTTQGTEIARLDDNSPASYININHCTQITPVGQTRGLIDVTSLDSSAREYKTAIKDGQEINLTIQYDPNDTQHNALRDDLNDGRARGFRITLEDESPSTTITFDALVTNWSIPNIGIDQIYTLEVTLKPTGDLVFA